MICYRAAGQFFTMKNDAETHRKAAGLPPAATEKIEVNGRDDLVALLNELVAVQPQADDTETEDEGPKPIPDYVPKFLHPK